MLYMVNSRGLLKRRDDRAAILEKRLPVKVQGGNDRLIRLLRTIRMGQCHYQTYEFGN